MALSNGTKQYILNYDSKYLYPYTLLQCIIDEDNPALIGETAIINKIAKYVQDSNKKSSGMVLGINNTDSDTLSLQKLAAFSDASTYKYKYFSGNAEFVDLPTITLDGIEKSFVVDKNNENIPNYTIKVNPTYLSYTAANGLSVIKSDSLNIDTNIANASKKYVYFDGDGKPAVCTESIGTDSNFIYYNPANGGFTASELTTDTNCAVYFNKGVVTQIYPENLIAGKLQPNTTVLAQSFPAIPYILPTNNRVQYACPTDPSALTILAYKPSETEGEEGELTWTKPTGFLSMEIKTPAASTDTSDASKYYIVGVEESSLTKSGASTLYSAANSELTKSIYFKDFSLYNASDERLKTFTSDIDIDFDKLSTIKKGIFYWNSDETMAEQLGVTAQSVKEVFPQIVSENCGMYSVAYDRLGVIALAAIDKLHKENEELKTRIKELEEKIK